MKRLTGYSQHFFRSPRLVAELIGHSSIKKTDHVIDIGAGSGVISSVLAMRAKSVTAVEYEPRTVFKLRENMAKFPNVQVYEGDFLTMMLPDHPYKVFANIPFHLSSQIVRKLTEADNPPTATYLIVQKQFARKLIVDSDSFTGQLGVMIGPVFTVRIRRPLRRTDFWPHPAVDTVLLEICQRDVPLLMLEKIPDYRTFVARCFMEQPFFSKVTYRFTTLVKDNRPSQMSLEQWLELYNAQISKEAHRRAQAGRH